MALAWSSGTAAAVAILFSLVAAAAARQPEAYQERLVAWLRADPAGFFHPALRWERLGADGAGPYALHAAADVPRGTPLIVLPRGYVLESHDLETADLRRDPRMCTTVQRMLREHDAMAPGRDGGSVYAPYLSYLFDGAAGGTSRGQLPAAWSPEARRLLDLIRGGGDGDDAPLLDNAGFDLPHVYDLCPDHDFGGGDGDADARKRQAQDAYLFLLSRGWKDKLLPVVDFVNHRNGRHRNVEVTPVREDDAGADVAMYAWRDLRAGEQLHLSYTECFDACCEFGDIKYQYGTPEVLADFGFVEDYPRRWSLYPPEDEDDSSNDDDYSSNEDYDYDDDYSVVVMEVTAEGDAENGDAAPTLRWIFETPSAASLAWIRRHRDRLRSVEAAVRRGVAELRAAAPDAVAGLHDRDHEAAQLEAFYEAATEVLELALRHKDDPVAVTYEEHAATTARLREVEGQRTADGLREEHATLLLRRDDGGDRAVTDEL